MSASSLKRRIELIERDYDRPGIPSVIVATCPLPCAPNPQTIERWLAEGVAHIAFRGHAVMYDGGRRRLTTAEWEQLCGPRRLH